MVTINNDLINETPVTLWYDDTVNPPVEVGVIKNTIAFNDVRLQIAKENSDDYYVVFNDISCRINNYGNLEEWPKGMFDLCDRQVDELIGLYEFDECPECKKRSFEAKMAGGCKCHNCGHETACW